MGKFLTIAQIRVVELLLAWLVDSRLVSARIIYPILGKPMKTRFLRARTARIGAVIALVHAPLCYRTRELGNIKMGNAHTHTHMRTHALTHAQHSSNITYSKALMYISVYECTCARYLSGAGTIDEGRLYA